MVFEKKRWRLAIGCDNILQNSLTIEIRGRGNAPTMQSQQGKEHKWMINKPSVLFGRENEGKFKKYYPICSTSPPAERTDLLYENFIIWQPNPQDDVIGQCLPKPLQMPVKTECCFERLGS